MTSYQSTEDMCETISLLHYLALTGTIEDDMWIIDISVATHLFQLAQKQFSDILAIYYF